jgi:hypothetical protein
MLSVIVAPYDLVSQVLHTFLSYEINYTLHLCGVRIGAYAISHSIAA